MSFPQYPEYKDSGVEWLGEVPAHWENWKVIHAFGEVGSGTTPPSSEGDWYGGTIPWITTSELRENVVTSTKKKVTEGAMHNFSSLKLHPAGSLAIAMYGATIGRLGILGVEATTNQACCVLSNPKHLTVSFSFYWLKGFKETIIALYASGGGQPNINQDAVASLRVPAPSIEEQNEISAFLDHETARIDALVEEQQRLIALLKEKRQAVISHAVTKGLDPDVPMKGSGVEWLGEVPAHWAVTKVAYHYEVVLGKMLDERRITGQYLAPYLRNTDVQWDRINLEGLPLMDFSPTDRKKYELVEGDLLVCEGGEVGRAAIWGEQKTECYYQKALHRMRPLHKNSETPRFMFYLLWHASEQGRFTSMEGKSTIAHLPAETLRQYQFTFPPKGEQEEIVCYLDRISREMNRLVDEAEHAIRLLSERRSAIISAAVTGKIDVRGWQPPTGSAAFTEATQTEAV